MFEILDSALTVFLERAEALPLEGLPPEKKLKLLLHQYTTTLVHYLSEVVLLAFASRYLRPEMQKLIEEKRLRYEHYLIDSPFCMTEQPLAQLDGFDRSNWIAPAAPHDLPGSRKLYIMIFYDPAWKESGSSYTGVPGFYQAHEAQRMICS